MLNVKQGSCKYKLLKSFGPIRLGNETQVYRLRDNTGQRDGRIIQQNSFNNSGYLLSKLTNA